MLKKKKNVPSQLTNPGLLYIMYYLYILDTYIM